ncbi:hypothetical protein PpBr36_02659 [Pyricularia pennisetigena]|uniref:hypothetical protein n=1 Tax=Pyricularia pennisetigena TaxID=1578925 RepID=UPI00114F56FA|nr:hypothetical protein PpBr36_02659 [Pyricularia pennisetigena]TLS30090.1 hypothetical protein PpBr36_02659 [Pyricularia pennisetigena]
MSCAAILSLSKATPSAGGRRLAEDKMFGLYGLLEDPSAEIKPEYGLRPSIEKSLAVMTVAKLSKPGDEEGPRWE